MDFWEEYEKERKAVNSRTGEGTAPGKRMSPEAGNKSTSFPVILAVVLAVLVFAGITIGNAVSIYKNVRASAYKEKLESAYEEITYGADMAERYATLERKVWRNCIYEESSPETDKYTKDKNGLYYSDFNDALSEFYDGEESTFLAVYDSVSLVDAYMSELKDCPEKYKSEYLALGELYIAYLDLTDLVVGTSSYSWNTFNEALENAKSNYKSALHAAKLMF